MIYGYARVSTSGPAKDRNSLKDQKQKLIAAGASEIIEEYYNAIGISRRRNLTTYGAVSIAISESV